MQLKTVNKVKHWAQYLRTTERSVLGGSSFLCVVAMACAFVALAGCSNSSSKATESQESGNGVFKSQHPVWKVYAGSIDGRNAHLMTLLSELKITDDQMAALIPDMEILKSAVDISDGRGGDIVLTQRIFDQTRKPFQGIATPEQRPRIDSYFSCDQFVTPDAGNSL